MLIVSPLYQTGGCAPALARAVAAAFAPALALPPALAFSLLLLLLLLLLCSKGIWSPETLTPSSE